MKIISGGQTGADRAALDIALASGIPCGGFCPKGRKSEDGPIPEKYPLVETATDDYSERTELNVKISDGTLILINKAADKGTSLTIALCGRYSKPFLVADLSEKSGPGKIMEWIKANQVDTLNIAGSRESSSPGIYQEAYHFLKEIFQNAGLVPKMKS